VIVLSKSGQVIQASAERTAALPELARKSHAAHVNRDQRRAARHEQVAPACDTGARLGLGGAKALSANRR
jgi:hypothetical protein